MRHARRTAFFGHNCVCEVITRAFATPCGSCTRRDPAVLHQRVMGVLRLLGPRHWASWRLLLLGVELHCGALEEAAIKAQVSSALGCVPAICSQNQICVYVAQHKGRLRGYQR